MSDTRAMGLNNFPLIKSQKSLRLGRGHKSSMSNSGQAVVEYMLLIFVSVTLVVTLATSVFQPLGQFVDNLNRLYIQCLLETGELPQLSSEEESTVCFEEMPQFAALDSEGNPISRDGSSASGSGARNEAVANRDGQTSNVGGAGGTARVNRAGGGIGASRRSASPEGRSDKTTVLPVDQSFNEGSGYFSASTSSGGNRVRPRKTRKVAVASLTDYEKRKLERTLEKTQTLPSGNDEGFTQTKKKIIVKPPPPPKSTDDLKIDLGYGHYIKMFLLIIFILFVIIVFGSQAFQLSKNWGNN